MDLEEPFHGDVVVALDEAARDVAVEGVGQDLVAGAVVGGMVTDQGVPRLLGVEHGGVELTAGLDAGRGEGVVGDPALGVADALEPEGVGQPAGGVDGEDEHLAAAVRRRHGRRRGRRRGLAHPAGTAGHDDLARGQQTVERAVGRPCRGTPRPASETELLSERTRHLADAAQTVEAGEEERQVQHGNGGVDRRRAVAPGARHGSAAG